QPIDRIPGTPPRKQDVRETISRLPRRPSIISVMTHLIPIPLLRRFRLAAAVLAGAVSAMTLAQARESANAPLFPDVFPTATPEEHGLISEKLDAIWSDLEAHHTTVFVIMRNDRIVYERDANGYSRTKPHYTASLAKALVGGMSLMLAIDDGLIQP